MTASAGVRATGVAKRAAGPRAGVVGGGGKRRRQRSADGSDGARGKDGGNHPAEPAAAAEPAAPPTLWQTVFGRDEVTGAVCNSLAMIGTRGGALLEALQPTLLQLLRHRSIRAGASGVGGGKRGKKQVAAGGGGGGGGRGSSCGGDVSILRSLDEEPLAAVLQGQRAAMACVLCCWEGLDAAGAETSSASAKAGPAAASSPLSALEKPMAAACLWAMKTAGTAEAAGGKSLGARLIRPVLVLLKRWPALLPLILALIVEATSEATAAGGGEGADMHDGVVGIGESQALEPVLRCLQAVVRDPGLRRQLRRRHVGALRETAGTLCAELEGSPLKDFVVQLRADVEVLGGGCVDAL